MPCSPLGPTCKWRSRVPAYLGWVGLGTWVGLGCSKCDAHAVTVTVKCPFSLCWQRHVFHALLAAAQHSASAMAATGPQPQQSWRLEPRSAARKTGSRHRSVSGQGVGVADPVPVGHCTVSNTTSDACSWHRQLGQSTVTLRRSGSTPNSSVLCFRTCTPISDWPTDMFGRRSARHSIVTRCFSTSKTSLFFHRSERRREMLSRED